LTYTKIRTCVPPYQNLPKTDDKISRSNTSLQSTIQLPQGRSSFRRNNCPKDTPPPENIATPISVLPSWVRWLLQPTPLISIYIFRVRYTASSSHVSNVAMTSAPPQTVIEGSRNRSRHQR